MRKRVARAVKKDSEGGDLKEIFDVIERDQLKIYLIRGEMLYKKDNDDIRLVVPRTMQL